jgi:hypothetical protein
MEKKQMMELLLARMKASINKHMQEMKADQTRLKATRRIATNREKDRRFKGHDERNESEGGRQRRGNAGQNARRH